MEHPTKYYSNIQEKKVADYLNWGVVPGSGATLFNKGDICSDNWVGECKTHTSPGNKLKFDFEVWNKIKEEANSRFKNPVLIVDDGSQDLDKTWCLIGITHPELFTEVSIEVNRTVSLYAELQHLQSLYATCPYVFLIVKRGNKKYGLMPLSEFREYQERVK